METQKIEVVFEKRHEFAFKLKEVMEEKSYTKAKLCKDADISRPTLNKLLACDVTRMVNFKKYVARISQTLGIEPETFIYGIDVPEIKRDRYLKHMITDSIEEIEDFVNNANRVEVVNVYSYSENSAVKHVLVYWLYL